MLFLMAGLGLVGFLDDYIKISKQRSLGLRSKEKLFGQTLVATIFAILALRFPNDSGRTPASTKISFVRDTNLDLAFAGTIVGVLLFVLFANVIIAGTSNGVNLTDGLDGLATGASVMTFAAYVLIGICINQTDRPNRHASVRGADPLAFPQSRPPYGSVLRLLCGTARPPSFHGEPFARARGPSRLAIVTRTESSSHHGAPIVTITLSVTSGRSSSPRKRSSHGPRTPIETLVEGGHLVFASGSPGAVRALGRGSSTPCGCGPV